ncbi:unnamed protein product [Peniophora sp. CBMAI 1063]|nr:unnamed protein product [Peniophora sp. CBMAI 1063]
MTSSNNARAHCSHPLQPIFPESSTTPASATRLAILATYRLEMGQVRDLLSRKEPRVVPFRNTLSFLVRINTGPAGRLFLTNSTSISSSIFYYTLHSSFHILNKMFAATRLHVFVCLALGIAVGAAPTGSSGSSVDARSPDTYDLTGGVVSLLLGLEGAGYGGNSGEDTYILKRDLYDLTGGIGALILGAEGFDGERGAESDEYILKRQLAKIGPLEIGGGLLTGGLVGKRDTYDLTGGIGALLFGYPEGYAGEGDEDTYILKRQLPATAGVGSLLGSNIGIQHAVPLAEAGLSLGGAVNAAPKRDLYDTTGGIGALLFGAEGYGGEAGEDEYILKRDGADVEKRSPDLYDLTGGIGALIFGAEGEGYGEGSDEDTYILKRQLERLGLGGLGGGAAPLLGSASTPIGDTNVLPSLGGNADLASNLGVDL